jgi:tetratricopeptide (TPR) repeat protein
VPTIPNQSSPGLKQPLPWVLGTTASVVYCLTLNHWASLSNIGVIARVSGWTWQPELRQPLTSALLYPFRLLPAAWLPLALNFFTAMCAALVLAILGRSVCLLSGAVRTPRPTSATIVSHSVLVPAFLAVAVCGLQLTFWEHATAFTGEMLDLLIFAYVIRCLLEFRNDQRESWLFRSAFIYGAGMTNNWAMIGYLPLYVLAIFFIKDFGLKRVTKPSRPRNPRQLPRWLRKSLTKLGFALNTIPKPVYTRFRPVVFDSDFFLHMALWGLAGLGFYLLLPIVQSLSPHSAISFWPALKANLRFQLGMLSVLHSPAFRLLAIASFLPVLVLVIGWKSKHAKSGYETRRSIFLNRLVSYPLHAFVLIIALWLSLDPTFSPRHFSSSVPMLSYYYLSAIIIGYCAAYLIQNSKDPSKPITRFVSAATYTLAIAVPLLLLSRNLSHIRITNGSMLHQFARELCSDIPSSNSVVVGYDSTQLSLLRTELSRRGQDKDTVVVEIPSLNSAQYHIFMARNYGPRWHVIPPTNGVDLRGPVNLLKLISAFAEYDPVVYLDPPFGALFDRPENSVTGFIHHFVAQPKSHSATNEIIWQQRWANHLQSFASQTKAQPNSTPQRPQPLLSALRLQNEPNPTAAFLAAIYSKSLNNWGVQSQRLGHWSEAGVWFRRSLDLNPQNFCAHINLNFNEQWQRGDKTRLNPATVQKEYPDIFGRINNWREVLSNFGPVDEPTFLFRTGRAFLANGNIRLAANAFQRSTELAPDWPPPQLWLAQTLNEQGQFASALDVTDRLANNVRPKDGSGLAQLLHCHTTSLRGTGRTNEISGYIDSFVRENGTHHEVLAAAANAYAENGMHEQQLATIEELLKREPNHPEWLSLKGLAELQVGRYDAAIATLTTALSLAPNNDNARLSRAIACLGADQLDAARDDYQQLLNSKTRAANALFGLGTVAWRKHETNAAIEYYQRYLTNVLPASPQTTVAIERLREMGAR